MKRIIWILMAFVMMVQCTNHPKTSDNQDAVTDNEGKTTSPTEAVTQIYGEVFDTYEQAQSSESVITSTAFDQKYMSSAYLAMDAIIDSIDRLYPAEIGFHEYDHWIQAQDWDTDLSYSVDSLVEENGMTSVWITITNCGTKKPLEVRLVKENDQWKIDDFISDGVSERLQMQEYIDANTKKGSAIS